MAYLGPTDLLGIPGTDPSAEETSQHKERFHSQIAIRKLSGHSNLKILGFAP